MFHMGYDTSLEGYKFLLKKVLENEWLALIIKPKKPGLLKNKLSNIKVLVDKVKETKRLYIVKENSKNHVKNFDNPPCQSAMAADLAIHDTMVSATAGIEAYLSGTRTVFFDRYNFKPSRFYKNKFPIVFNDWEKLWINAQKFFDGKYKQFGIWDHNLLDEIDNFNDNEADKRLAFLTQNIFENISKLDKSNVLFKSKEEYYNYCILNYNKNLS